ncbi:hypothetical protein [Celeribacter marinus]|uniref:Uncharacterized protein n=1 Tax=Celeribacter marinus TaxID=1397108 RepID=A0A0P0ACK4_9RHOB|nr:hypothetical protein [Celeribacter marinus]ALI56130.1 hypothetical protein IMCC12053_2183 [Celeribacter marinus]SFK86856.1 hypothetical protein SAMN05444421_109174 [Celeribacter marinus]
MSIDLTFIERRIPHHLVRGWMFGVAVGVLALSLGYDVIYGRFDTNAGVLLAVVIGWITTSPALVVRVALGARSTIGWALGIGAFLGVLYFPISEQAFAPMSGGATTMNWAILAVHMGSGALAGAVWWALENMKRENNG